MKSFIVLFFVFVTACIDMILIQKLVLNFGIKTNNVDCGHIANRAMKRIILKCLKCKESFSARPSDVVRRRKYVVFSARDFIVLLL